MKEFIFNAYENYPINLYVWDEVKQPKAVIQLAHGMAEHLGRYDDFAKFLNSNGYIVIGDDHRGHGKTCGMDRLGMVDKTSSFFDTIEDMHLVTEYAKNQYKLDVILFGHSYGSFLSQGYIEKYSQDIKACVLCGSAKQDGFDVKFARVLATIQNKMFGKDKPANLIAKLSFGAYEKQFDEKVEFAWGNRDPKERAKYIADPMSGYVCSIGFYKGFFDGLAEIYKIENLEKIRKDLPLFIISGDKDPVGGQGKSVNNLFVMYQTIKIQNVNIKLYKDARHEILNELNKEEVYTDVLEFFNKNI